MDCDGEKWKFGNQYQNMKGIPILYVIHKRKLFSVPEWITVLILEIPSDFCWFHCARVLQNQACTSCGANRRNAPIDTFM